jgi:hypothetical protein
MKREATSLAPGAVVVTSQEAIVHPPQTRLDRVGFRGDEIPRHQFQFAGGQGGDPWTSRASAPTMRKIFIGTHADYNKIDASTI